MMEQYYYYFFFMYLVLLKKYLVIPTTTYKILFKCQYSSSEVTFGVCVFDFYDWGVIYSPFLFLYAHVGYGK